MILIMIDHNDIDNEDFEYVNDDSNDYDDDDDDDDNNDDDDDVDLRRQR